MISYLVITAFALICLLPFILIISASFSTESVIMKEGFGLLPKEFTMEAGELTNTLKIRRPVINRHYASQIEAMYA